MALTNQMFKQYVGTREAFSTYLEGLYTTDKPKWEEIQHSIVFIHESPVAYNASTGELNANSVFDGWIFANGFYYTAKEAKGLDFDALKSILKGGSGISVVEKTDETTGDKYLEFSSVVENDITIAGGPLDSSAVRAAFEDGIIPAGMTMQQVLEKLFLQEKWGTPTESYSFTRSVAAPTVNLSKSGNVQVGTKVTASASANATTASQSVTFSGYEYGYSNNGTTKTSSNKSYTQNATPTISGTASLNCSFTNLVNLDGTAISANAGASTEAYVKEGNAKYNVAETGQLCTPVNFTAASIYNVSNLGNVRDTDVKTVIVDKYTEANSPTNSGNKTVTGIWGYFMGSSATVKEINEATVKSLTWKSAQPTTGSTSTGDIQFILAVPNTTYTDMDVIDNNNLPWGTAAYTDVIIKAENDMQDGNGNIVTHTYRVFYINNDSGKGNDNTITITLK